MRHRQPAGRQGQASVSLPGWYLRPHAGLTGGNAAKGNSNANGPIQLNSHVLGTGNVRLESGNDTVLKGAVR